MSYLTTGLVTILALAAGILSGLPFRSAAKPLTDSRNKSAQQELSSTLGARSDRGQAASFEKFLEEARHDPDANIDDLRRAAQSWADSDPHGMLAHLMETGDFSIRIKGTNLYVDLIDVLFTRWATTDPRTAASGAAELASHPEHPHGEGYYKVFWTTAESDPAIAREILTKHPDMLLAIGFADRLPLKISIASLDVIASHPDIAKRNLALSRLPFSQYYTPTGVEERWEWFDRQPIAVQQASLASMLTTHKTVEFTDQRLETLKTLALGQPHHGRWLMSTFGREFAEFDKAGTEEWINENFTGYDKFHTMRNFRRHAKDVGGL